RRPVRTRELGRLRQSPPGSQRRRSCLASRHVHVLVALLLAQGGAPPPAPEAEPAPALVRPEDFSLSEPGGRERQGTLPSVSAIAPPDPEPRRGPSKDEGFDFVPVPVVTFNSDTGFGLGLVLLAYIYGKDFRPYRHGLTAQFFATTTGFQGHYITWDAPHLLGPVRVQAHLEFPHH